MRRPRAPRPVDCNVIECTETGLGASEEFDMKTVATLVALVAALGCGSAAIPSAKLTDAQSEIRAAEAVGAKNVPQAALHLKHAQDEVNRAKHLIKQGDEEEADLVLDAARVDAELALTLARGADERAQAAEEAKKIEMLSND